MNLVLALLLLGILLQVHRMYLMLSQPEAHFVSKPSFSYNKLWLRIGLVAVCQIMTLIILWFKQIDAALMASINVAGVPTFLLPLFGERDRLFDVVTFFRLGGSVHLSAEEE
jgi:hypothetical protein